MTSGPFVALAFVVLALAFVALALAFVAFTLAFVAFVKFLGTAPFGTVCTLVTVLGARQGIEPGTSHMLRPDSYGERGATQDALILKGKVVLFFLYKGR